MTPFEDQKFESVKLSLDEKFSLHVRRQIPRHELNQYKFTEFMEELTGNMVLEVHRTMYGREVFRDPEVVTKITFVPMDWWQHLKQRWFPKWMLAKWPVKNRTIATHLAMRQVRVCPHINVHPMVDPHVYFMRGIDR